MEWWNNGKMGKNNLVSLRLTQHSNIPIDGGDEKVRFSNHC